MSLSHAKLVCVQPESVPECDVLLFITTPAERKALEELVTTLGLIANWQSAARYHPRLGEYFDIGVIGAHRVLAVPTRVGALAAGGSAGQATLFQAATNARALIAVGMAFGISQKVQERGEVLVSRRVFPYDIREVRDGTAAGYTSDYTKTNSVRANGSLVTMFERASKRGQFSFKVSFGTLLSGSARISSTRFRDELAQVVIRDAVHGTPIGGDMEAAGLLSVARRWIVVKAISDFADSPVSSTSDAERARACRNAVQLTLTALQNHNFHE